jgi:glycosyltransferase involved in cell wall biosynthesis
VTLEFLGSGLASSSRRLTETVRRLDPAGTFLTVSPAVPHADVVSRHAACDGFVFASMCENMPSSLLEAMAAGLTIACSDRSPMPGLLRDGGLYFDPESPASIADSMGRLLRDAPLRSRLSARAHELAQPYSWTRCAHDTFEFLARSGNGGGAPTSR